MDKRMRPDKRIILLLGIVFFAWGLYAAENKNVSGIIMELGSTDPVEGVYIQVTGSDVSAETDALGAYSIGPVDGNSELTISSGEFKSRTVKVGASAQTGRMPDIYIERTLLRSDTVIVQGKKENNEILSSTLTREEIKRLPGNAGDALRAMKDLPGIDAVNDFVSQLVVQGGGPSDNSYYIDDIPWPVAFHFGGILSTVNSEILSDVQLNSAGFGPAWGGKMGSVLNANTRPGKNDRLRFSADLSLITAQLFSEGPAFTDNASYAFFCRRSYADVILKNSVDELTALPFFWDAGIKADIEADRYNAVKMLFSGSYDSLRMKTQAGAADLGKNFNGEFRMDNSSCLLGGSWKNTAIPGFKSDLTAYYTNNYMFDSVGLGFNIDYTTDTFGIKESIRWDTGTVFGMENTVYAGAELEYLRDKVTAYLYENILDQESFDYISSSRIKPSVNTGVFLQNRLRVLEPLYVTAGVRYDKNGIAERDTVLPRFSLEYDLTDNARFGAAWGLYSQFADALQTDPQIGNPGLRPNLSSHTVVNLEKKFSPQLFVKLSAYYKTYEHLVVSTGKDGYYSNDGTGMAKGAECFVKWDAGEQFFAWLSYSFSSSQRYGPPENKWVLYQYDQPHNLTLAASYKLSPAAGFGAKLHYTSGPLKKRLLAGYKNAFYIADMAYDDTDESRLEDYLRLDLRGEYTFRFEGWSMKLYAEVMNALNCTNPQGLVYPDGFDEEPQVIRNIPIFPYLGITAEF